MSRMCLYTYSAQCLSTYVQYLFTVLYVYISIRRRTLEADHLADFSVSTMRQYQRCDGTYEREITRFR